MKIFNSLEAVEAAGSELRPCAVALGNFDGVHKGHQQLIGKAVRAAQRRGLASAVFTFSNHPKTMLPGGKEIKNIIYQEEKIALIEKLGVDYLFNVEFTHEIQTTSPADFVEKLLAGRLRAAEIFCGFNYRFGYKAAGNVKFLREEGRRLGIKVNVIEPVIIDGEVVSSTLIRSLIRSGDVDECAKFLGRNYDVGGEVVVGNRLGRKLGFPTSNIMIDESMVTPPNGVYITYCIYNGVKYPSVTNVGVKPTVGVYKKNVETHIFNFDKELYGKQIKVEFLKMTRDEVKFDNVEELSAQIARDCQEAEAWHGL